MVLFYNQFFKNAFGEVVPYNNNLIMIFQVILLVNVGRFQHPNGRTFENGPHKGKTLTQVWDEDRALFGEDQRSQFPLLTKDFGC